MPDEASPPVSDTLKPILIGSCAGAGAIATMSAIATSSGTHAHVRIRAFKIIARARIEPSLSIIVLSSVPERQLAGIASALQVHVSSDAGLLGQDFLDPLADCVLFIGAGLARNPHVVGDAGGAPQHHDAIADL